MLPGTRIQKLALSPPDEIATVKYKNGLSSAANEKHPALSLLQQAKAEFLGIYSVHCGLFSRYKA
jgi:hypothetical protein